MGTRVRSYSKINLGLAIGPVRPDGFHGLTTLYQTLDLHDLVTVTARRAEETKIVLTTNHPFVPRDGRNTAWKMVEKCLVRLGISAEVEIHIEKKLPVQGGMGAGSGNAAAALIGLERELGMALLGVERLAGGGGGGVGCASVSAGWGGFGVGTGGVGGSAAGFAGDALCGGGAGGGGFYSGGVSGLGCVGGGARTGNGKGNYHSKYRGPPLRYRSGRDDGSVGEGLTLGAKPDRLQELSLAYASLSAKTGDRKSGTSGIIRDSNPEIKRGLPDASQEYALNDLAENTLLALVRTGIGNGHASGLEKTLKRSSFLSIPPCVTTKRQLMGIDTE